MTLKLTALMAVLALPGVIATAWLALPTLYDPTTAPVPLETLQIATVVQGILFVVISAVLGAALSPRIGLSAPALQTLLAKGNPGAALRPALVPGLVGGVMGAIVILAFYGLAPSALAPLREQTPLPLVVRVLYGGVTEEVLIRWGVMSLLIWLGWKSLGRGTAQPSPMIIWLAILLSSLLFGVSHVPSAAPLLASITPTAIAYITVGNAAFGIVAGYLYWRHGFEAAVLAHVIAHVLAFIIRG